MPKYSGKLSYDDEEEYINPYDNGSLWSERPEEQQYSQQTSMSSYIAKKYGGSYASQPRSMGGEIDPLYRSRKDVDYYSSKLNQLGIEPEKPDEEDDGFWGMFKEYVIEPIDYFTTGFQAIGNTFWGAGKAQIQQIDKGLKEFEDNDGLWDDIKDTIGLVADNLNPLNVAKNLGAGLDSGANTLSQYLDPFRTEEEIEARNKKEVDALSMFEAIYNGESKAMRGVGEGIDFINPVTTIAREIFGAEDEKAKQIGRMALGLGTEILAGPDLGDMGKALKYVDNIDDVKNARALTKDLGKLEETRNMVKKTVLPEKEFSTKIRNFMDEKGTPIDEDGVLKAYSDAVEQEAFKILNKASDFQGGMTSFRGIRADSLLSKKLFANQEGVMFGTKTLDSIAGNDTARKAFKVGSYIYNPVGSTINSKYAGRVSDYLANTKIGKDVSAKFSGGELAEAKRSAKENPDKAVEYVAQAYALKYARSDFKNNVQQVAQTIAKYGSKKDVDLDNVRNTVEKLNPDIKDHQRKEIIIEKSMTPELQEVLKNKSTEELKGFREKKVKLLKEMVEGIGEDELKAKFKEPKFADEYAVLMKQVDTLNTAIDLDGLDVKKSLRGHIEDEDLEKLPDNIISYGAKESLPLLSKRLKILGVKNFDDVAQKVMRVSNDILDGLDAKMPEISKMFRGTETKNLTEMVDGNKIISPNAFDELNKYSQRYLKKELKKEEILKLTPEQEADLVHEIMKAKNNASMVDNTPKPRENYGEVNQDKIDEFNKMEVEPQKQLGEEQGFKHRDFINDPVNTNRDLENLYEGPTIEKMNRMKAEIHEAKKLIMDNGYDTNYFALSPEEQKRFGNVLKKAIMHQMYGLDIENKELLEILDQIPPVIKDYEGDSLMSIYNTFNAKADYRIASSKISKNIFGNDVSVAENIIKNMFDRARGQDTTRIVYGGSHRPHWLTDYEAGLVPTKIRKVEAVQVSKKAKEEPWMVKLLPEDYSPKTIAHFHNKYFGTNYSFVDLDKIGGAEFAEVVRNLEDVLVAKTRPVLARSMMTVSGYRPKMKMVMDEIRGLGEVNPTSKAIKDLSKTPSDVKDINKYSKKLFNDYFGKNGNFTTEITYDDFMAGIVKRYEKPTPSTVHSELQTLIKKSDSNKLVSGKTMNEAYPSTKMDFEVMITKAIEDSDEMMLRALADGDSANAFADKLWKKYFVGDGDMKFTPPFSKEIYMKKVSTRKGVSVEKVMNIFQNEVLSQTTRDSKNFVTRQNALIDSKMAKEILNSCKKNGIEIVDEKRFIDQMKGYYVDELDGNSGPLRDYLIKQFTELSDKLNKTEVDNILEHSANLNHKDVSPKVIKKRLEEQNGIRTDNGKFVSIDTKDREVVSKQEGFDISEQDNQRAKRYEKEMEAYNQNTNRPGYVNADYYEEGRLVEKDQGYVKYKTRELETQLKELEDDLEKAKERYSYCSNEDKKRMYTRILNTVADITELEGEISYLYTLSDLSPKRTLTWSTKDYKHDIQQLTNLKKGLNRQLDGIESTSYGETVKPNQLYRITRHYSDETIKQLILDNKVNAYKANHRGVLQPDIDKYASGVIDSLNMSNRTMLELKLHKTYISAYEYRYTEKLSTEVANKTWGWMQVPDVKEFLSRVPEVVKQLGLVKNSKDFTNIDRETLSNLVNLKKNMAIIKKIDPDKYTQILRATKDLDVTRISRAGLSYINDVARNCYGRYPKVFNQPIQNTPLTDLLSKTETPTLEKLVKGQKSKAGKPKAKASAYDELSLRSNTMDAITKEVEKDLASNPLIKFGVNANIPESRTFLKFETPSGGFINLDTEITKLPKLDVGNLDDARLYITNDLGGYQGLQKDKDIAISTNVEDIQAVFDHESVHYFIDKIKMKPGQARKYVKGISDAISRLDGLQRHNLISLIESVGIDSTDIKVLSKGLLTNNIATHKALYKQGHETIATMGSYLLHNSPDVRSAFREFIGDDLYKQFYDDLSEVTKSKIKDPKSFPRNSIGREVDLKIERLEALTRELFPDNPELFEDFENVNKRMETLNSNLNIINSSRDEIKERAYEALKEYQTKSDPEFIKLVEEKIDMYHTIEKEISTFSATLDWKRVNESEKALLKYTTNLMSDLGYREGIFKSKKEALDYCNYVAHQWSPEWINFKEKAKYTVSGDILNNPINHFKKDRNVRGTIEDINKSTMNEFGVKMFEDNYLKIVLNRAVKGEQAIYKDRAMEAMLEVTDDNGKLLAPGLGRRVMSIADFDNLEEVKNGSITRNKAIENYCKERNIKPVMDKDNNPSYFEGYFHTLSGDYLNENGLMILREFPKSNGKKVVNILPSDYDSMSTLNQREVADKIGEVMDLDRKAISSLKSPLDQYKIVNPADIERAEIVDGAIGSTFIVDKKAYEAFQRSTELAYGKDKGAMLQMFDKMNNVFKMMAVTSGQFHFNNAVGNIFNSYIGAGVNMLNPKTIWETYKVMRGKEIVIAGKTSNEIMFDLTRNGLLNETQLEQMFSMQNVNDFYKGTTNVLESNKKKNPLLSLLNPFDEQNAVYRANRSLGDTIEGFAKVQNYITHLKTGMNETQAIELVKKCLFDYSDLTQFETDGMKRIFSFYTFMKKNLELQIDGIANSPYKYYLVDKTISSISEANETEQERKLRPDYMKNDIAIGGGNYLKLNLPLYDLDKITNPSQLLGSSSPFIKTPIELAMNKNMFNGSEISKTGRTSDYAKHTLNNFLPLGKNALNARDAIVMKDDKAMDKLKSFAGYPVRTYDKKLAESISMSSYGDKLKNQYYQTLEDNPQLKAYVEALAIEESKKRKAKTKLSKTISKKYGGK